MQKQYRTKNSKREPDNSGTGPLKGQEADKARGGCLGAGWRRRTRQPAISPGELDVSLDPGISEWGNPTCYMHVTLQPTHNCREATRGTETSKYPEEKKERSIP